MSTGNITRPGWCEEGEDDGGEWGRESRDVPLRLMYPLQWTNTQASRRVKRAAEGYIYTDEMVLEYTVRAILLLPSHAVWPVCFKHRAEPVLIK